MTTFNTQKRFAFTANLSVFVFSFSFDLHSFYNVLSDHSRMKSFSESLSLEPPTFNVKSPASAINSPSAL